MSSFTVNRRLLLVVAALTLMAPQARADSGSDAEPAASSQQLGGAGYSIDRYSIDGGGARSSGGAYSIEGSIGQPDADPLQPSSGGSFAITGGFWGTAIAREPLPPEVFNDGFE